MKIVQRTSPRPRPIPPVLASLFVPVHVHLLQLRRRRRHSIVHCSPHLTRVAQFLCDSSCPSCQPVSSGSSWLGRRSDVLVQNVTKQFSCSINTRDNPLEGDREKGRAQAALEMSGDPTTEGKRSFTQAQVPVGEAVSMGGWRRTALRPQHTAREPASEHVAGDGGACR